MAAATNPAPASCNEQEICFSCPNQKFARQIKIDAHQHSTQRGNTNLQRGSLEFPSREFQSESARFTPNKIPISF